MLSAALFVLYTADCRSKKEENAMINFAEDTSLSGLIQESDSLYRQAVEELTEWCDRNVLELNVTYTKELVIDFTREKSSMDPIEIRVQPVEIEKYDKYLGTIVNSKLDWSSKRTNACTFSDSWNDSRYVDEKSVARFCHHPKCHALQPGVLLWQLQESRHGASGQGSKDSS